MAKLPDGAHWERGFRVHGLWLGTRRLAWVGLPPRCDGGAGQHGYFWEADFPGQRSVAGAAPTLRQAKHQAEAAYEQLAEAAGQHHPR